MKVLDYLLGSIPIQMLIGAGIFVIIGVIISKTIDVSTRRPNKDGSPVEFSWKYFWSDNNKRIFNSIVSSILIVFCSLRFSKDFFGTELSMVYALLLGLCLDAVKVKFRKITKSKFEENTKTKEDEKQPNV